MENASKALSIAGSILIGVLLIALLIFAYNQFILVPQQEEKNAKIEQTADFNKKYESYNKQNLKGNKLKSLLNMAADNNERYKDISDYQIKIECGTFNLDSYKLHQNDGLYDAELDSKISYKCTGVEYKRQRW